MRQLSVIISVLLAVLSARQATAGTSWPKPRLMVVLVIDQFRADYLTRFQGRFRPARQAGGRVGGFNYLMADGSYFPFARYDIFDPATGPGHATILTGSYPYQGGIAFNEWYDLVNGEKVYCVEDKSHHLVGASTSDTHAGTSPQNLLASTVGDELKNAGYSSRVVTVSLKDRAAILLGGHRADLALWFEPDSFRWVSSDFYLPRGKLPQWVDDLNRRLGSRVRAELVWKEAEAGALVAANGVLPVNRAPLIGRIGPSFPHHVEPGTPGELASPFGLTLTTDAALHAVDAYKLGRGKDVDLLAVSFSSHDWVGHAFGPNSREIEEMTVAEDKALSDFFNQLAQRVPGGLANVTFALTADHGVAPDPDLMAANRVDAGRIDSEALRKQVEERLEVRFGRVRHRAWIKNFSELSFYIDRQTAQERNAELSAVEAEIKSVAQGWPGIAQVFTRTEFRERKLPPGMFERQILKTYMPDRSGDVVALPRPFYFEKSANTADHSTGYSYDRSVPLLLAGFGIRHERFSLSPEVVDLAPTLSYIGGVLPPSNSEGRVLSEALNPNRTLN